MRDRTKSVGVLPRTKARTILHRTRNPASGDALAYARSILRSRLDCFYHVCCT